ncbi:hypothetical protein BaRGS_00025919 [Batillaria attramentaria]|uniref:Uncharacterized protein n=1 Tax=Batillaria attramentaria TaxID=370345 RepID=A0ABD0K6C4_9CAEN
MNGCFVSRSVYVPPEQMDRAPPNHTGRPVTLTATRDRYLAAGGGLAECQERASGASFSAESNEAVFVKRFWENCHCFCPSD